MAASKDPISVRIARINAEITDKTAKLEQNALLSRETLLDALQALYDECCLESLQKYDSNIAQFVDKFKDSIKELKQLRVSLSDFEVKNVIGRGHFGEVHLVKEKQTGDVYAMKTIRKSESDQSRMSFSIERDVMAFSNSNWLTSLQYAFQDNTYLFYVMEYHSGGDLLGLLYRQGGTLPESAATFYIFELILALNDLHMMGYVHRDIKPDNILLDRLGHIKLADFGSAAKLNEQFLVDAGPPVGTPDYVAPEVLQCLDNKTTENAGYGVSCDFWSVGVLAYELTIGSTPFAGQNSTSIYSKIMNHANTLKFPPDVTLSQAYVSFIKSLVTDQKSRLTMSQIKKHKLFKKAQLDKIKNQVPPYVPKISSIDDTSNFTDIQAVQKTPSMEAFKKRTQFSGRNLPFIGFTYTNSQPGFVGNFQKKLHVKDEQVENLKSEVESLKVRLVKNEDFDKERRSLEHKLEVKIRKLDSMENLRNRLERDLASNIAECAALKRTLELERKDRSELEKKALDLIKSAKLKWEVSEKNKVEALTLEIDQQKEKIAQLATTNSMLNEQLQHALNMEVKHKDSLEHVQVLNRRSVMGLESRLDKVTSETQGVIADLQKKLSEETHQKTVIENELSRVKTSEIHLKQKLSQTEKDFESWRSKIDDAEQVIGHLNDQVSILVNKVAKIDEYKDEISLLKDEVETSNKIIKELENRNTMLQTETDAMEECKKEMERMKSTITRLEEDKKVEELQQQLLEEREKSSSLIKQLQESENIMTENQALKELRIKYWRMEKDLDNAKIDKRILERELKDSQAELQSLQATIKTSEKSLADIEQSKNSALLELNAMNESLSLEVVKLKNTCKNLENSLDSEKRRQNGEKIALCQLKEAVQAKSEEVAGLNRKLSDVEAEKSALGDQVKQCEVDIEDFKATVRNLQKEKREAHDELEKTRRELENTNLNLNALREACTMLENQLIEFESIVASFESKQTALNSNTEKLIQDLCDAKQQIQEAKKTGNEEKSLKLLAEAKAKRLSEEIDSLQNECASYQQQCTGYKQYSTELSEELTAAEERISELEVTANAVGRQIGEIKAENQLMKQELSDHLTLLNKAKESNCKLKHQLSEVRNERDSLLEKVREVEERINFVKEREMRLNSTLLQQIKLIDYLQVKVDDQYNKKKSFTEVLFGSSRKENHPPLLLAMNYRDLEKQLAQEKQTNKLLNEEISKLKSAVAPPEATETTAVESNEKTDKVLSPKSRVALQQIVNSPGNQKNDVYRQNSVQRMHHNIPHRFVQKYSVQSTSCASCSRPMGVSRPIAVCTECNLHCHFGCKKDIPNTCGLPKAFAQHYVDSLEASRAEKSRSSIEGKETVIVESWVKIPGMQESWDEYYAVLTNTHINIYRSPPKDHNSKAILEFPLKPNGASGKVICEPLETELGISISRSDLPLVLKVEVDPINPRSRHLGVLELLTFCAEDKEKWALALQKIYHEDLNKLKLEKIFEPPKDMVITCIVDLTENIKMIGTEQGLYCYHEKILSNISGLTEVHQINIMQSTETVLMIVNKKRTLISCDLNHLINLAQCTLSNKPKLKFKDVDVSGLNGFLKVEVPSSPTLMKICIATKKHLIILNYDVSKADFTPARVLDTAEPTGCALFTENSLIVGADKFFEIDLTTYRAEEFLDVSDGKLKQTERCYKMGSYPLGIMQTSKNPKEYLLAFNEFAVFVDEYGRSTRRYDLMSTRRPFKMVFQKPYLYIVQFSSIEIIRLCEDTCNTSVNELVSDFDIMRLQMDKFQYVGRNKEGIYVVLENEVTFISGKKMLDMDGSSIASESIENGSDRFSFTSSMVQSLDGNLSDTETTEDKPKKVEFAQTDL